MTRGSQQSSGEARSVASFTPGPWMRDGISVTLEKPAGEKRPTIATCYPQMYLSSGQSYRAMLANARLIAAAPDMFEALAAICACYPKNSNAYRIATAALAKARGES